MGKRVHREIYYCEDRQCYVVPLTRGYEALIDEASVPLVSGISWSVNLRKKRRDGSRVVYAKSGKGTMHRLIMGFPEGMDIDHIDGDGLNNMASNLRVVTRRGNMQNTFAHRSGRLIGCYCDKQRKHLLKPWQAQITVNGRRRYLGYYKTELDAHLAYVKALERVKMGLPPILRFSIK